MSDDRLTNIQSEAALLGAMMIDNSLIGQWADRVQPGDFYDPLHARIFSAMLRFSARGMQATPTTLFTIFQNDKDAEYGAYLDTLIENEIVTIGVESFASQIVDLASRRAMREALHSAMEALATDFDAPISQIVGRVDDVAWGTESRGDATQAKNVGEMVGLVGERDDRIAADPGSSGMENAFVSDLNKALGPIEEATLNFIAGRPGMGKSALASSAALGYSANGHPGIYAHGEMTAEQMAMRATSDLSFAMGMPLEHETLKKGGLTPHERQVLTKIQERAALIPLDYIEIGECDVRRLWAIVARKHAMLLAQGKKLKFVVVDYIGKLTATDSEGNPIEDDRKRTNVVSKVLLRMAQFFRIAVFALAQLSRAVEQRANKRPLISDLRDSGNLEQDGDSVLMVFREEYYLEDAEPKRGEIHPQTKKDMHEEWETEMNFARGKMDLIVGKNRHGQRRIRTAKFIGKHFAVRGGEVDEYATHLEPLLI